MLRIVYLLVLASVGCKLIFGRWPWDYLSASSTRQLALRRARGLLAVAPGATRSDIVDAHRRLIAMVHPDRGGTNEQVHEANAARDMLLDALPKES